MGPDPTILTSNANWSPRTRFSCWFIVPINSQRYSFHSSSLFLDGLPLIARWDEVRRDCEWRFESTKRWKRKAGLGSYTYNLLRKTLTSRFNPLTPHNTCVVFLSCRVAKHNRANSSVKLTNISRTYLYTLVLVSLRKYAHGSLPSAH